MPKAVGRVRADLQRIALLGANGVRPIAAAKMRRRLAPSPLLEPAPAELSCEIAWIGNQPGGETEFGSEAGDGFKPCVGIGAYPQQHRRKIRIDGSPFIRPRHPPRLVHQIEIFGRRHLQNAAASGF